MALSRCNSVISSLHESDFRLPDLEDHADPVLRGELEFFNQSRSRASTADSYGTSHQRRRKAVNSKVAKRNQYLSEINFLKKTLTSKPREIFHTSSYVSERLNRIYNEESFEEEKEKSTLDHPTLDSVEEKLEDLRQEELEKWCRLRGKTPKQKYSNEEKRKLRKWFKKLDFDGSGEVNVEELQDSMISAGVLRTKEQVTRILANADKNNTMGIDFEEFLQALSCNKLADQTKLKKLQKLSADPFFTAETLITEERRRKIFKSIVLRTEKRQKEIENLYVKLEKPKISRKERDQLFVEQEQLEEKHAKMIYLNAKFLHALSDVLDIKKKQMKLEKEEKPKENDLLSNFHFHPTSKVNFKNESKLPALYTSSFDVVGSLSTFEKDRYSLKSTVKRPIDLETSSVFSNFSREQTPSGRDFPVTLGQDMKIEVNTFNDDEEAAKYVNNVLTKSARSKKDKNIFDFDFLDFELTENKPISPSAIFSINNARTHKHSIYGPTTDNENQSINSGSTLPKLKSKKFSFSSQLN